MKENYQKLNEMNEFRLKTIGEDFKKILQESKSYETKNLNDTIISQNKELKSVTEAMNYYKKELLNREENYNRIFKTDQKIGPFEIEDEYVISQRDKENIFKKRPNSQFNCTKIRRFSLNSARNKS